MEQPGPPLEVKVLPPAIAPSTLSRPRLNAALREASQRRLTTLIAGPGFGKTTALADWATEQPVAWYTASADDEDAPSLAAGLVAAMRLRAPTLELPIPRAVGQAPDDEGAAGDPRWRRPRHWLPQCSQRPHRRSCW